MKADESSFFPTGDYGQMFRSSLLVPLFADGPLNCSGREELVSLGLSATQAHTWHRWPSTEHLDLLGPPVLP